MAEKLIRLSQSQSISCFVYNILENDENCCFPELDDIKCFALSTTQKHSAHCHSKEKKPGNILKIYLKLINRLSKQLQID